MRVVLDTNVVISALRSRNGASFQVLNLVGTGRFDLVLSVPLVLEYESVALRMLPELTVGETDVNNLLDYLCSVAIQQRIHFLWRPQLSDPKDEMVLELVVAAGAILVTHNRHHFQEAAGKFGVNLLTPQQLLNRLKVPFSR